jgi:hypothetical protein
MPTCVQNLNMSLITACAAVFLVGQQQQLPDWVLLLLLFFAALARVVRVPSAAHSELTQGLNENHRRSRRGT